MFKKRGGIFDYLALVSFAYPSDRHTHIHYSLPTWTFFGRLDFRVAIFVSTWISCRFYFIFCTVLIVLVWLFSHDSKKLGGPPLLSPLELGLVHSN